MGYGLCLQWIFAILWNFHLQHYGFLTCNFRYFYLTTNILAVLAGVARAAGVAEQHFSEGPFMIGIGDNAREFLGHAFAEYPNAAEESDYAWALEMVLQLAAVQ
ncbi:MAG: hypothetical protein PHF87_10990 [Desulfotomaculaceae bacterium]|nr:hypothetical protein [Desulfotomaculaceae bacterium]